MPINPLQSFFIFLSSCVKSTIFLRSKNNYQTRHPSFFPWFERRIQAWKESDLNEYCKTFFNIFKKLSFFVDPTSVDGLGHSRSNSINFLVASAKLIFCAGIQFFSFLSCYKKIIYRFLSACFNKIYLAQE